MRHKNIALNFNVTNLICFFVLLSNLYIGDAFSQGLRETVHRLFYEYRDFSESDLDDIERVFQIELHPLVLEAAYIESTLAMSNLGSIKSEEFNLIKLIYLELNPHGLGESKRLLTEESFDRNTKNQILILVRCMNHTYHQYAFEVIKKLDIRKIVAEKSILKAWFIIYKRIVDAIHKDQILRYQTHEALTNLTL